MIIFICGLILGIGLSMEVVISNYTYGKKMNMPITFDKLDKKQFGIGILLILITIIYGISLA